MEKLFNTSKTPFDKIMHSMTKRIKCGEVKKVIDAGSGKISASLCLKFFPNAELDAIIFPGDNRKKNPMENAIGSDRIEIVEADICTTTFRKQYDFCLVHLSLGEATRWGNSFENMFHHITDLKAKFFLFIDVAEDPCVHFRYMEAFFKEKGFKILKKKKFKNPNPEHYPKVKYEKYKLEYTSKHYIAYLVEKDM